MSCIDLNDIGRKLFKDRYNLNTKRKLTFEELRWYVDDAIESFKNSSSNVIHNCRDKQDFIESLKQLFLLCYLNNINLNDYIKLEFKDEEIK